jgi:hypothetical protein
LDFPPRWIMTTELMQHWLMKKLRRHIFGCWLGAALALVAGAVVLFITFWLAYCILSVAALGISALTEICFNHKFQLGHTWRLTLVGLFLVALFVEWLRRSPWDLGDYDMPTSRTPPRGVIWVGGTFGAFGALLANPQASATFITELLYSGPRLVLAVPSLVREACRSTRRNLPLCARILALLVSQGRAVSYQDLTESYPGMDGARLRNDLGWIPDLVFLENSLSMTDEMRKELGHLASENENHYVSPA